MSLIFSMRYAVLFAVALTVVSCIAAQDGAYLLHSKRQQLVQTCTNFRLALRDSYTTLEQRYSPIRDTFIARSQGDIELITALDTAKQQLEVPMEATIQRHEFFDRGKGKAIMEAADQMWRVVEEMRRRGIIGEDGGGMVVAEELWRLVVGGILGGAAKYLTTGCAN